MKRGPVVTLVVIAVLAGGLLAATQTLSHSRTSSGSPLQGTAARPGQGTAAPPAPDSATPPAPDSAAPPGQGTAALGGAPAVAPVAFPAQAKYVGHAEGAQAMSIAVTVRNDQVSAYLCDGNAIEGWYQGSVVNGVINAKGRGDNALTGSLAGSTLSGTVSAKGMSWTFTADPVTSPAGLYRSKIGTRTDGWIKNADGTVTGLGNDGGVEEPAPPLDPTTAQSVEGGDPVVSR